MSKFNSYYELLHGDESIPHTSHFIDNFSGDQLGDWWTTRNLGGSGTFVIENNIDEGFSITTGAITNDESQIDFNNIRQYDPTNSIIILTGKAISTTSQLIEYGFTGDATQNADVSSNNTATHHFQSSATNYSLRTGDNSTNSFTEGTIIKDTSWHLAHINCNPTTVEYILDNIFQVTKTTNLPTTKLQPKMHVFTQTATNKEGRLRYMECYNK